MQFKNRSVSWQLIGVGSLACFLTFPSFCETNGTSAPPPVQTAAVAPNMSSDTIHPALNRVSQAIAGLNISRWKAPGEVRSATQQNADSIQRDLNSTLPGLLAAADAAPDQISAVFAVYRNIDALYDVLLRISQTADLAAPANEASGINDALHNLESARTELGNNILNISKNNEAETLKLRAAIQQAAAAQAAEPPKTVVVNDGPAKSTNAAKKKKKPAPKPATQTAQPQQ